MKKPTAFQFLFLAFIFCSGLVKSQQYISVNSNYTAEQLVRDIFIGAQNASCITVENISVSGWNFGNGDLSYGYFNRNGSSFEVNEGILLSSGRLSEAVGSFPGIQSATASGWNGDQDLERAAQISNTTNATFLEFDFISHQSNKISFDYMFLSEQYLRSNDAGTCGYTDGFAFLIKKIDDPDYTNLAIIPGTNTSITSNNVRGQGGKCPANNQQYFGHYNPDYSPVSFNGQTAILTATTNVIPGQKYHIKLVIADQGNGLYDSGVVLKAGSFVGDKDLGDDLTFINNLPICEGVGKTLNATTAGATSYQWYKNGSILPGAINALFNLPGNISDEGTYSVLINLSGCTLRGSINVEVQRKPIINNTVISYCDSKFAGNIAVNFSDLFAQIITNFSPSYVPKFYLTPTEAQTGIGTPLSDGWLLTSDTRIYVRVESIYGCPAETGTFTLKIGNKIPLLTSFYNTPAVCDDNLLGVQVNLADYISHFTTDHTVNAVFYNSLVDAKAGVSGTSVSANQTLSATKTFGIRFEGNNCANVAELTINIKSPKKSTVLIDQTICGNAVTTLDAGSGFDFYEWSTGETTQTIDVSVGDYWVDLYLNGCVYRQEVKVTEAELPQITHIDVLGNTATIYVIGGKPPYQYSLNDINFQSSNVFYNITRGKHTAYVRDSQNCESVMKDFIIINLINVITPNHDGINDVLDYSDLKMKKDVKMEIYDRYGNPVFISANSSFIWDGTQNGRNVATGSYWYSLSWIEPDTNLPVSYKGWILVKNRD